MKRILFVFILFAIAIFTAAQAWDTPATGRKMHYSGTGTLDFPALIAAGCDDLTIAVTGAAVGDIVILGIPNGSVASLSYYYGWVSATDVVSVRHCGLGIINPASGSFKAIVMKVS